MAKLLKLLMLVAAVVLVLAMVAILVVTLLFDPNDYKPEIVTAVDDATGRTLTLEGNLELQVFPRLRIALGPAEISNAPGFGDAPFARIEGAELDVALLPLLTGRVRIGQARLEGLTLNLARNARGGNNWQDLAASSAPAETGPAPTESHALDLDVGRLEIVDANLNWSDATTGSSWQLANLNLQTSGFGPGVAFPLSLAFRLAGQDLTVDVDAKMRATLALADNRYRLEDLAVDINGQGAAWPGTKGEAEMSSALLDADLAAGTLKLDGFSLAMLGVRASGNLDGQHLLGDLTLAGALEIASFDPHELLDALGVKIETADDGVLREASGRARLAYDPNQIMLTDLALKLDQSELKGRAGLKRGAVDFDLAIDSINIDRYLPPSEEGEASTAEEGSLDAVDLPVDVLKSLAASGKLAIGQAELLGLKLANVRFDLAASNGQLRLTPQAALYGGTYGGSIRIDARGATPALALEQTLSGVDMTPLATDLLGEAMVAGTGDAKLNLSGTGSNLGAVRRGLDGDVSFSIKDGAWEGMDLWYELRRARAVFDGQQAPSREGPRRTPFSNVSATGTIEDAVLTNRDLTATLPFLSVSGAGTVNLLTDAMKFDLTARFVDGPTLQSDPAMAKLAGQELPLKVGGTLDAPTVSPDFSAIVRARVESQVQERVEEQKQNVREQVQDRLRKLLDRK